MLRNPELADLFDDILKNGKLLRVKVTGHSMSPFIRGGEVVVIKNLPFEEMRTGDIVLFKNRRGDLVLHRLVRKRGLERDGTIQTRGDSMPMLDEPVRDADVLGRVVSVERGGRDGKVFLLDMESWVWRGINLFVALASLVESSVYYSLLRSLRLVRFFRPSLKSPVLRMLNQMIF
jgi:signal peptidase